MSEPTSSMTRRTLLAAASASVASASLRAVEPAGNADAAIHLHLLEPGDASGCGTTFGLAWPKGKVAKDQGFSLTDKDGKNLASQSWPTAYWPDGSVKWTAHAAVLTGVGEYALARATRGAPEGGLSVTLEGASVVISTGALTCTINTAGGHIIESLAVAGRETLRYGTLVFLRQDGLADTDGITLTRQPHLGQVSSAVVEQSGPVRAVVRLEGAHALAGGGKSLLPFVVRLYFYAGSPHVRIVHTFTYDLDDQKDFIAGLGIRFDVPLADPAYDRHVRFVGRGGGVWAEGVQNLTGLRRDPGEPARDAQWSGRKAPPLSQWQAAARERIQYVPVWGDYSLRQLSADGFDIRKRTKPGHAWIPAAADTRAPGVGYIGGASGGVAFGLRDFWQRHPASLDIRNAHTDAAQVTLWMYSPDAPAMDVRFYHDGMGETTHELQYNGGLEVTYEDYEPGFGTAVGIARTSEVTLWPVAATPSREALAAFAGTVARPPILVAAPEAYHRAGVFGNLWAPVDRSTPGRAKVEDRLTALMDYYLGEPEQRHFYGFWDYGDIMHTYDADRHCWRYDVGGFAWDNSELSPDLWIWMTFLRTGRADVFRFGEAMIKHTTDVDSYHAGPFKLLGTRHGVQHWGDSAKQLRISTAVYRRFYYYLTADDRIGDCLHALRDADVTFLTTDPTRKIRHGAYQPEPHALAVGFGTDWGSIAIALLTEYERTLDEKVKQKLLASMRTIGGMPHGFFSGGGRYDLDTGAFTKNDDGVGLSHLSAAFGLPEVCAELIQNFDVPEFTRAWMDYAKHYNTPREERQAALGFSEKNGILVDGHSRGTAWAAKQSNDPALARRAWHELLSNNVNPAAPIRLPGEVRRHIAPPLVIKPIDEVLVSTNDTAQWGTAAIENLALIPEALGDF